MNKNKNEKAKIEDELYKNAKRLIRERERERERGIE